MAEATLIKEFLVGLGFKTDEASMKKFKDGIGSATKEVGKLVTAIAGISLAIAASVAKFTASMEELYFVSKRTGASVLNIKALDLAARDLGASSQEARGALEGLASFMRNTPNAEGFLKNMGVQTRDAKGHLLDTSDMLVSMGKRFRELQKTNPGMALAYARMFGISENMELAMMDPHFAQIIGKYRKQNKGTHWNEEAKKAHDQMDKIREMQSKVDALTMRVGDDMEKLTDKVLKDLDKILTKILDLDKATNGWSTDIALAGAAFLALLGPIARVAKAMKGLFAIGAGGAAAGGAAGGAAAAEGAAAGAAASGLPSVFRGRGAKAIMGAGAAAAERGLLSRLLMLAGPIVGGIAMMLHSDNVNAGEDEEMRKVREKYRKETAMQFFMRMGWTKAQAAGIVANLIKESGLSPTATGDNGHAYGIAQWWEPRQAAFKKWAGHDIRQSTEAEQRAFIQYELTHGSDAGARMAGILLRAAKNARQAGRIFDKYYERPHDPLGNKERERGELATKIEQETNIHIHGVHDPHKAAKAAAHEQRVVNSDILRNTKGTIR